MRLISLLLNNLLNNVLTWAIGYNDFSKKNTKLPLQKFPYSME